MSSTLPQRNRIDANASAPNRLRRNMQRLRLLTSSTTAQIIAASGGGGGSSTGGTVTSVALSGLPADIFAISGSPVTTAGTLTFTMTEAGSTTEGYLSSTDWNIFNSKLAGSTNLDFLPSSTSTDFLLTSTSTLFLASSTTLSTVFPLQGGGFLSTDLTLSMTEAGTSTEGWLSSTDWNIFNSKLAGSTNLSFLPLSTVLNTTGPITGGGSLSTGLTIGITQAGSTTNGFLSSTDWNFFESRSSTTGTVTSVALTMPSIFAVGGSPITTAGTLAVTLATELANTVFAGPSTGAAAIPTFRPLTSTDIPALQYLPSSTLFLPLSTVLNTTGPLTGGGNLSTGLTLGITQAGSTTNGFLSSTDWLFFDSRSSTTGTVTSVALSGLPANIFTISGSPVTSAGTLTFSMAQAGTSTSGYLSSTDWNTFNSMLFGSTVLNTAGPITGGGVLSTGLTIGITQVSSTTNGFLSSTQFNALAAPGGSTTDVQFNSVGIFAGTNFFTTDGRTYVTIAGNLLMSTGSAIEFNGMPGLQAITALSDYFGGGAGNLTMTGINNTAFGNQALVANSTGNSNVAMGLNALATTLNGNTNVAIGNSALFGDSAGSNNTAVGTAALISNTSGNNNIALGTGSLFAGPTTGSGNINIGNGLSLNAGTLSNTLDIGNLLFGTGLTSTNTLSAGRIGIGTKTPQFTLDVNGTARISSTFFLGSTEIDQAGSTTNGWLSSTDWNTFNLKLAGSTLLNTTGPITGGGSLSTGLTIGITQAGTSTNGFLSSTDWNFFESRSSTTGTVTSVAQTVPSFLTIAGSPITTSGTLAIGLATEAANTVFAGPVSGAAAVPTFRVLGSTDIPALPYVTSVALSGLPANIFTITGSPVTSAGTLTFTMAQVSSTTSGYLSSTQFNALAKPGGVNTDVQFNSTGVFAGTAFFTTDGATYVGIGVAVPAFTLDVNGPIHAKHFLGATPAPTIAAGTGAGTGPTIAILGTDSAGKITLTTGTVPAISSPILTVTFNAPYAIAPMVVFSSANPKAAGLAVTATIYVTATTTTFVFNSDTTALTAATQYIWNYHTIGIG